MSIDPRKGCDPDILDAIGGVSDCVAGGKLHALDLVRQTLSAVFGVHPNNLRPEFCSDAQALEMLQLELEMLPEGFYVPVDGRPDCAPEWRSGVMLVSASGADKG